MADITFRYRKRKDPKLTGTWMLVGGKQTQRISARRLSRKEIEKYRSRMILSEKGYLQANAKTFRKQDAAEHMIEVKEKEFHTEITDIQKDPSTGVWKREKADDRDYISFDDKKKDEKLDQLLP